MSDQNKVSLIDTNAEEQTRLVQNMPESVHQEHTDMLVAPEKEQQQEHINLLVAPEKEQQQEHINLLVAPEKEQQQDEAIITTTSVVEQEEWESHKKEHPLASLSLDEYENNDPWAAQPEENALLQTEQESEEDEEEEEEEAVLVQQPIATTTVFDMDNQQKPLINQVLLDKDTSATMGFQNFQDSDKIYDLNVTGQLPEWLNGEHFTIGPSTFDIKYTRKIEIDGELQNASALYTFGHWFDALPLVNRFDLNGSRNAVTYRHRSTSQRLVEKIREHHGYAPQYPNALYMSDTNQTVLTKFLGSSKSTKPDAEPCGARILTHIPGLEGRLFAQNHANHVQELDPFDLKPIRLLQWNEINPAFKGTSSCPNGKHDSRTGEYINYSMEVGYKSVKYNFFSISDKNPQGSLLASVTAPMAYVNDFSITPKYIIFVICPVLANAGGVKYNWNESIMDSFSFRASEPTLFYVISREKGDVVATYRSDPCFVFNHINAYEDSRIGVCLDMICYPDDTIARQLTTDYLRKPSTMQPSRLMASEVRRFLLVNIQQENIAYMANKSLIPYKNSVTDRIFGLFGKKETPAANDLEYNNQEDTNKWYSWMPIASYVKRVQPSIELPQINPNFSMYKHTFMYGLGFSAVSSLQDGAIWDSIVKTNVDTKQIMASWHQDFCYPSEAVFVPRPSIGPEDEVGEDEGVLMSVVMNSAKSSSFLLVLDAGSFQVLATADLERLVPLSFAHGSCRLSEN